MLHLSQISFILPELIIFLSGIFILIYGAFSKTDNFSNINILALMAILIAGLSVFFIDDYKSLFNNAFVITPLAKYIKLLVLIISFLAIYISYNYLSHNELKVFEYPVLLIFSVLGMLIMISSNDLIMLYISIELQSLSLYVLVALRRRSIKASEAALKYFILGSIASAIILYGASMIYSVTGATNYNIISAYSKISDENIIFSFGIILILSGIAFKLSAAPFHMWTPDVYEGSPSSVTTILVTLPKLAALTVLINLLFKPFIGQVEVWQPIIIIISVLSMAVGSISALKQENLKRLFAFSTIANIGYVLIGLACVNEDAVQSSLLYIFVYTFGVLGVFSFIMMLRRDDTQLVNISDISGMSKLNPILSLFIAILLLSMAGIPPFGGFFAKLYIFSAAIESDLLFLAISGVIFSVVSAYYYLKIIKAIYLDEVVEDIASNLDKKQYLIIAFTSLLMLTFIFYADELIRFINFIYI